MFSVVVLFKLKRSYSKDLLKQAIVRMANANIKTHTEIERFQLLAEKVESIVQQKDELDIDFGNAPDEFKGKQTSKCSCVSIHLIKKKKRACI